MSKTRSLRNPTLTIGLIVFAVAAGLFITAVAGIAFLSGSKSTAIIQPAGGSVGDSRKKYTREEFSKLVIGKTEAEVIASVGRPESTSNYSDKTSWNYYYRVLNPVTGKYDHAHFDFRGGIATDIRW